MTFLPEQIPECFLNLESSARLELMLQLLQMLSPMELRFIAVCLEDLARKNGSYVQIRDLEKNANDPNVLRVHFSNLVERDTRSLLTTLLPLVQSTNAIAASTIFEIFQNFAMITLPGIAANLTEGDAQLAEEIILLFSMGKHHPAFKFEERKMICDILDDFSAKTKAPKRDSYPQSQTASDEDSNDEILGKRKQVNPQEILQSTNNTNDNHVPSKGLSEDDDTSEKLRVPPVDDSVAIDADGEEDALEVASEGICPRCRTRHGLEASRPSSSATSSSSSDPSVYLTGITVSCCSESQDQKIVGWRQIRLEGSWSNGDITETLKIPGEIYDYHRRLLDLFPRAAGCHGHNRTIPYFPGVQHLENGNKVNMPLVKKYMSDLKYLSPRILGHSYTCEFFGLKREASTDFNMYLSRLFDEPKKQASKAPEDSLPNDELTETEENNALLLSNGQGSTTTDEDRDVYVKNGTVHACVFHNSSSKPTHSEQSVAETEEISQRNEDVQSIGCVSLPARLQVSESDDQKLTHTHLHLNGLGTSDDGINFLSQRASPSQRRDNYQSQPAFFSNDPYNRSNQTTRAYGFHTFPGRSKYPVRPSFNRGWPLDRPHIPHFVMEPLYSALRRRDLLHVKPSLCRFSLEELEQMGPEEFKDKTALRPHEVQDAYEAVLNARAEWHEQDQERNKYRHHNGYNSYNSNSQDYYRRSPRAFEHNFPKDNQCPTRNDETYYQLPSPNGLLRYAVASGASSTTETVSSLGRTPFPSEYTVANTAYRDGTVTTFPRDTAVTVTEISKKPSVSSSMETRDIIQSQEISDQTNLRAANQVNQPNNPAQVIPTKLPTSDSLPIRSEIEPADSGPKKCQSAAPGNLVNTKPPSSGQNQIQASSHTRAQEQLGRGGRKEFQRSTGNRQNRYSDTVSTDNSAQKSRHHSKDVIRRAKSDSQESNRMRPGDSGWLQSEEEFPSILGPVNANEAQAKEAVEPTKKCEEVVEEKILDNSTEANPENLKSGSDSRESASSSDHDMKVQGRDISHDFRPRTFSISEMPPPKPTAQQLAQLSLRNQIAYSNNQGVSVISPLEYPYGFSPGFISGTAQHHGAIRSPFTMASHGFPAGFFSIPGMWPAAPSPLYPPNQAFGNFAPRIPLTMPLQMPHAGMGYTGNQRSTGQFPGMHQSASNPQFNGPSGISGYSFGGFDEPKVKPHGGGRLSCPNCGKLGHTHEECTEQTFDEITKGGNFSIRFGADDVPQTGEVSVDTNTGGMTVQGFGNQIKR